MRNVAVLLFAVVLARLLPAQAEDSRGLNAAVKQLAGDTAAVGTQYAVFIAINRYKDWNALRYPVADAREITEILSRRYYVDRFIELYDEEATKAGIVRLFNQLIITTRPEDGVFIFYAGHGHLDQMSDTGFWIPADGGLDTFEQDNWLPNAQIRGFISKMKARHIVLMSDSCFSGDILNPTRAITPEITSEYFRRAYSRVSRQVLTSGASETVPDSSEFARGLKMALEGNTAPQLDPIMLYSQIRLGMKDTTPLLGDLKNSGHQEGGSFLFFLKDAGVQAPGGEAALSGPDVAVRIDTPTGTLIVAAGTEGRLLVDGSEIATIPEGGTATLERLGAGSHFVAMLSEDGTVEGKTIHLRARESLSLAFGMLAHDGGSIPSAAITIDGNFDDWKGVRPLFVNELPENAAEKPALRISSVSLAKDSEFLYMRYDIADPTKPTFLRPHNFSEAGAVEYSVSIGEGRQYMVSASSSSRGRGRMWAGGPRSSHSTATPGSAWVSGLTT